VLVIDALGEDHGHLRIVGGDGADLIQRLVVASASEHQPGRALGRLLLFADSVHS